MITSAVSFYSDSLAVPENHYTKAVLCSLVHIIDVARVDICSYFWYLMLENYDKP